MPPRLSGGAITNHGSASSAACCRPTASADPKRTDADNVRAAAPGRPLCAAHCRKILRLIEQKNVGEIYNRLGPDKEGAPYVADPMNFSRIRDTCLTKIPASK